MTGAELSMLDLVGGFIGFFLTLFVLSYALGDNVLFRLAVYLFVGVSAGFVAASTFYSILWPQLFRPMIFGSMDERLLALIPLVGAILLFAKISPRLSILGAPVMAFLVGVGAATIIGGSLFGTFFPQIRATQNLFSTQSLIQQGADAGIMLINAILILVGMIATIASFQFGTRFIQNSPLQPLWKAVHWVGRGFVAITFGAIFAGIYTASLTALVERFQSIINFIRTFVLPG